MLRQMTPQEATIMEEIWHAGSDISQRELIERMEKRTGAKLHRNTISTFLRSLADKKYITTYHVAKTKYIHIEYSIEQEIKDQVQWAADYFFNGDKVAIAKIINEK